MTVQAPSPEFVARQQRLARYEAKTSGLLSTLAFVYLFTYSVQSIWFYPDTWWYVTFQVFSYTLWMLFVIDLLARFIMSPTKKHFFRKNWFDTLTCAIPQLRALRALRGLTKNGPLGKTGFVSAGAITTAALSTLLVVWVGGLMVLNAERGASGAEIKTAGDAFWWAFETVTTVGYGDFVPVTALGRFFAVGVMFIGISVVGVISAGLAASLVKQATASTPPQPAHEVIERLDKLTQMVSDLEKKVAASIEKKVEGPGPS